jgi:beta-galactosidase
MLTGGGTTLFSLRQDGNNLTGSVEGAGGGFFGGADTPVPITEGKVDGDNVFFKAGNGTYSGTLKGDQIELQRTIDFGFRMPRVAEPAGPRPAIGPPPDGSDPSIGGGFGRSLIPMVLHRVDR